MSNVEPNNKIRELRQKKGLSQKQLALEMEVSQPTASAWENGTKFPASEKLGKLADLLGVTVDYLLYDKNEKGDVYVEKENQPLSNEKAAEVLLQKLNEVGLTEPNGLLSDEMTEIILNFISANKDMLKQLLSQYR